MGLLLRQFLGFGCCMKVRIGLLFLPLLIFYSPSLCGGSEMVSGDGSPFFFFLFFFPFSPASPASPLSLFSLSPACAGDGEM